MRPLFGGRTLQGQLTTMKKRDRRTCWKLAYIDGCHLEGEWYEESARVTNTVKIC